MPPEQIEGPLDLADLGFDIRAHEKTLILTGCAKAHHSRGFTEIAPLTQDAALLLASKTLWSMIDSP
jgi:hypothetical protein